MSNGLDQFGRPHQWGWDPEYWETRPGQWGPPGIFLPPELAAVGEKYPLNPASLQRMMGVPITRRGVGGQSAYWGSPVNRLFLAPGISAGSALHEYGHAMQPSGFAPAYRQLMETGEYVPAHRWYDLQRRGMGFPWRWDWELKKRFAQGAEREAYAEYPELHFTEKGGLEGVPERFREYFQMTVPEQLRQYYPWLRWDVPTWYAEE